MSTRAILTGPLRLILAVALVYVLAWLSYYSRIPAGQFLNEGARATLDAALTLAQNLPTDHPGHSLYTYILSLFARFSENATDLRTIARALNALAFLVATGLTASAAGHYWRRNRAVWIAGLLVGLNPVLVFWAGEISPILVATAFVSLALWQLPTWLRRPTVGRSVWIGASLSVAALLETTLLPLALLWPLIALALPHREQVRHLLCALIPIAVGIGILFVSDLALQSSYQWHIDQLGLKLYGALSNLETSEDRSYGLYRQLHLLLYLNPIHWGLLFIMAAGGAYARFKEGHQVRGILLGLLLLAVFSASFALNESGSQARVSLIPLMSLFAAGVALLPKTWRRASWRTRCKIATGGVLLSLFTYAGYLGTPPSQTWEQDYVYLAEANIHLGKSDRAIIWAEKALELNPGRNDMQEVLILAQFNQWALGNPQRTLPIEIAKAYLQTSRQMEGTATTRSIEAIYLYKLRKIDAANAIWRAQRDHSALALLCLYWTGSVTEIGSGEIEALEGSFYHSLLWEASQINRSTLAYGELEKRLDTILAFAY